jgi:hypothetical protein
LQPLQFTVTVEVYSSNAWPSASIPRIVIGTEWTIRVLRRFSAPSFDGTGTDTRTSEGVFED